MKENKNVQAEPNAGQPGGEGKGEFNVSVEELFTIMKTELGDKDMQIAILKLEISMLKLQVKELEGENLELKERLGQCK